ncbi:hypothetical protein DY023_16250 [Microbacterium bovistercoris]|uniref:Flagellar protein FlgN n=1 Tax=Microbacterium bovistercoris TaxID=2293570 RepID=A0A371NQF3_9MICO|nr:hypothetical protein [Microbacterium bovistercoris]REJ03875.1 hypothetical protein DY023_16250 [Microbacterium bovistercoris]
MAAEKVKIDYDLLSGVRESITRIIAELEDAPERNGDVAGAIGAPYERAQLGSLASDFRGSWEPKRDDLIAALDGVGTRLDAVIESYSELDEGA